MRWFRRRRGRHSLGKGHQPCIVGNVSVREDEHGIYVFGGVNNGGQITVAELLARDAELLARDGHIAATLPDGSHIEFPDQDTADAFADYLHEYPMADEFASLEISHWVPGEPPPTLRYTLDAAPPPRGMVR